MRETRSAPRENVHGALEMGLATRFRGWRALRAGARKRAARPK